MEPVPVLVSWSGGKDAAWMLHVLRQDPAWRPVALLTTLTRGFERVAMQGIRRSVLQAQAQAVGLPVIESWQPQNPDNGTYEAAFAAALAQARASFPGLRRIAFGDLFLEDIRDYRRELCARLDWEPVFPVFGLDTAALARRMIDAGLRATITCVDTTQLDARFAGRAFDADLLDELPPGVDRCGERGEFHTCVHDGPMFAKPLALQAGEQVLRDGRFQYADLALVDAPPRT